MSFEAYLEGQKGVVSRLLMGASRASTWFVGAIKLPTKSPDPKP